MDVLVQGAQMGLDAATGGAGASMWLRSYGQGAQEARLSGADTRRQMGYGAAVATVEMLTEKLADGLAGIYGKGAADDLADAIIARVAKNAAGQRALKVLSGFMGEASEELISSAVNPWLQTIYSGKSAGEEYSEEELSEWGYSALVGGLLGAGMTGASIAARGYQPQGETGQSMAGREDSSAAPQNDIGAPQNDRGGYGEQILRSAQNDRVEGTQNDRVEGAQNDKGMGTQNDRGAAPPIDRPSPAVARVREILAGSVSNSRAEEIMANPALREAFQAMTGTALEGTKAQQRSKIKSAARVREDDAIDILLGEDGRNAPQGASEALAGTGGVNTPGMAQNAQETASAGLKTAESATPAQDIKNAAPVEAAEDITDNVATSDTKQISRLIPASISQIKQFVSNALQKKNSYQYLKISDVSPELADTLASAGIYVRGFSHVLKDNDIRHINLRHGAESNQKHQVSEADIVNVQTVIDNYDNLYRGYDTDNGNPTIVYEYKHGDRTFYVEEVLDDGGLSSKQMLIVGEHSKPSFLKKYKKIAGSEPDTDVAAQSHSTSQSSPGNHVQDAGSTAGNELDGTALPQVRDVTNAPRLTPEAELEILSSPEAVAPDNSISSGEGNVNQKAKKISEFGQAVREAGVDAKMVYDELGSAYGTIPEGERAAREARVPLSTDGKDKTGRTARTVMEAGATPESRLEDIRAAVVDGQFAYVPITNAALAAEAEASIRRRGWNDALRDWTSDVRAGKADEKLAAMGAVLINNAANSKMSGREYISLAGDYAALAHRLARGLAAQRILKTLSPEGRLYGVMRSAERINEEAGRKFKVELSEALIDKYRAQTTDEGRDAVIGEMQQNIADRIPSTLGERLNAIRYLNMLGNFKTQIRNVSGNLVNITFRKLTDALAELGELATGTERTKSLYAGKQLYGEAWADYSQAEDLILGEAKYGDFSREFERGIDEKRTIFKVNGQWGKKEDSVLAPLRTAADLAMKGLEGYREATNWAMNAGDSIFARTAYANALGGWLKAHGVKRMAEASPALLERGRQYAVKEAQEATFRDNNAVSTALNKLRYRGDNWALRGISAAGEAIMPFRKTPANVLVRATEASPLGFLVTAGQIIQGKRNGKALSGSEIISRLSKNLGGSGLFLLGMLLSAAGRARGTEDDEKKAAMEKQMGMMDWSVDWNGDGSWATLDWASPLSIPFFMGVKVQEAGSGQAIGLNTLWNSFAAMSDVMLDMSMLQGVNNALENAASFGSDTDAVPRFLLNAAASYLTQLTNNTLLRQGEYAIQEYRTTGYTDPESEGLWKDMQYPLSRMSQGIPGWDFNQQDYLDAWGRRQSNGTSAERFINSFLNPANTSKDRSTEVDAELMRLYESGMTQVLPQKAARSLTIDKEPMTSEQYRTYSEKRGQTSLELVTEFMDSREYKSLDDAQRAEIIKSLYDFAASTAADKIRRERGESAATKLEDRMLYNAGALPEYLTARAQYDKAVRTHDYDAIDILLAKAGGWDETTRNRMEDYDSDIGRLLTAAEGGVKAGTYIRAIDHADADGNGYLKQEELYRILTDPKWSERQREAIWESRFPDKGWDEYAARH